MNFKKKFKYRFDQLLSKGTISLVFALFTVTFVAVVLIGLVAYWITKSPDSALSMIWASFMKTLDPGNLAGEEGTFFYIFLMTIASIVGIFITSILISIISSGFQTKLENLQRGTSQIIEKNHTLILGWNDNVPIIVSQLIEANKSVKHPKIAILSEQDMMETYNALKQLVKSFHNTKIIIRTGSLFDKSSLETCAIDSARSVIISDIDDAKIVKTLLAIKQTSFFSDTKTGHVTAIFTNQKTMRLAQEMCGEKLVALHLTDSTNRIMAQTCLQPGLSLVYQELFDFCGNEFYFYKNSQLVGKTVVEAINMFNDSILIGVHKNKKTIINPDKDMVISEEDEIIIISEDEDKIFLNGNQKMQYEDKMVLTPHIKTRPLRNILSIGYNCDTFRVIAELFPYVQKGTHVKFLVPQDLNERLFKEITNQDLIEYDVVQGVTYERETLEAIDYTNIDTIIVFANSHDNGERSDSETLLTVLNLKQIEKERKFKASIIIEIEKNENEFILKYASVDDFIISNVLANKMLCQISENKHLREVYQELLGDEGSEIYLKHVEDYVILNEEVDFYTVSKSAVLKNEIAIGYKKKSLSENGGIVINPKKDEKILFSHGDCIILIAID
ncbi:MAG: TrkA C-terminal domain-containing protein [Bacilli bacterium]|nr:TrkA C-terminal domain-containing protein [Bacilli bacterium]